MVSPSNIKRLTGIITALSFLIISVVLSIGSYFGVVIFVLILTVLTLGTFLLPQVFIPFPSDSLKLVILSSIIIVWTVIYYFIGSRLVAKLFLKSNH